MRLLERIKEAANDLFSHLQFEEGDHRYTYQGLTLPSVSSNIKTFVEDVDWRQAAYYVGLRDGKTTDQVLREWAEKRDAACEDGHNVHDFAERYAQGLETDPGDHPKKQAVVKFLDELKDRYVPILFELRMLHYDYLFAGYY